VGTHGNAVPVTASPAFIDLSVTLYDYNVVFLRATA